MTDQPSGDLCSYACFGPDGCRWHDANISTQGVSVTPALAGVVVRYACDACCRFWATDAELQAHACGFNDVPCPHCPDALDQGTGYGHRADCPTFTEPTAIVRELAASDAPVSFDWQGDVTVCVLCDRSTMDRPIGVYEFDFNDPTNHEPSCLWRRAREWCANGG